MSLESTYDRLFGEFRPLDLSKVPEAARKDKIQRHKGDIIADLLGLPRKQGSGRKTPPPDEEIAQAAENERKISNKTPLLQEYIAAYSPSQALEKYLFDDSFSLRTPAEQDAQNTDINAKFQQFTSDKGYFNAADPKAQALYKTCYALCEHRAKFIENNNTGDEVASRAFNMMALFSPNILTDDSNENAKSTVKNLDKFIAKHVTTTTPIHDLFMHNLPEYKAPGGIEEFSLKSWKAKLQDFGMDLVSNFSDIPKIENPAVAEASASPNIPATLKEFRSAVARILYDKYKENPALANLFKYYNTPEETFDRALKLMGNGTLKVDATGKNLAPKSQDNIPNVSIKVSDSIYMVKLPANNPRALILGDITNCCQSVDGESEACVLDGVNLANNGFYVFIKADKDFDPTHIDWNEFNDEKHKIIGQAYAWRGKEDELTLDSLEILESFRNQINVPEMMQTFGDSVNTKSIAAPAATTSADVTPHSPKITRLMLGIGGGTESVLEASALQLSEHDVPASMKEGRSYGDARKQYEVYTSSQLQEWRKEAEKLLGKKIPITSKSQLDCLTRMSPEDIGILQSFDGEKTLRCISYDARECYADTSGHSPTFKQLEKFDWNEFLIDANARACYADTSGRSPTFEQLKKVDDFCKIPYLTSMDARACYADTSGRSPTFEQLKEVDDFYKIPHLTSHNARCCYAMNRSPTFEQLKEVDDFCKIPHLTSMDARACYADTSGRSPTFEQLKEVDDFYKIPHLTSRNARYCYAKNGFPKFNQLKVFKFDREIEELVRNNSLVLYTTGKTLQEVCDSLNITMPASLVPAPASAAAAPVPIQRQSSVERLEAERGRAAKAPPKGLG